MAGMSAAVPKIANLVSSEIMAEVGALAESEGRALQALIDEALTDLIEKRKNTKTRAHVLTAYHGSHEQYAELYRKLAK